MAITLTAMFAGAFAPAYLFPAQAATAPEPPRVYVDSSYPVLPTGHKIYSVKTSCGTIASCFPDLQSAVNAAAPGDEISVQANATFAGGITLPKKTCTQSNQNLCWIVIRTSNLSSLPAAGVRVAPSDAANMPKITAPGKNTPAFTAAPSSSYYRLVGLEVEKSSPSAATSELISLGTGATTQNSLSLVPSHFVLDRMYIHGDPTSDLKRGVGLNSSWTAIVDSYITDCHVVGQDAQAIGGANGPGPFKITNNYLAGAGENVIFGGDDPKITDLIPSDIEFRNNYLTKPLSWRVQDPSYAGIHWTAKNIFELKNAQRVLFDGNILENSWLDAQTGYAVALDTTNQYGTCLWCAVTDVTFTNNIIRHAGGAFILQNNDWHYLNSTGRDMRFNIANNLIYDIDGAKWGYTGNLASGNDFLVPSTQAAGPYDVQIRHNTIANTGRIVQFDGWDSTTSTAYTKPRFVFTDNIVYHNNYGFIGTNTGWGDATLNAYTPDGVITSNVVINNKSLSLSKQYAAHPGNFFPASDSTVFVSATSYNFTLPQGSTYKAAATDKKDIGVDFVAVNSATANTQSGSNPGSISTPTPLAGDLNLDHVVNSIDYSTLNSHWFRVDATSDINHDGIVNSLDFSILNENWLKTW